MIQIEGFDLIKLLYRSSEVSSGVFKRLKDNKIVILKFPNDENPSSHVVTKLRHEYLLLRKFDTPYIVKALDLIETFTFPVLVLEKTDQIALEKYLAYKPLELEIFFKIAKEIIKIVAIVHQKGITHKDIKPNNILIKRDSLEITLIDFGIASQTGSAISQSTLIEGSFLYISPEQTGRMNAPVDFRTDFYSLGITFYQMLTGMTPYSEKDPLDLIYDHIAKPIPLLKDKVDVPEMVSELVAKLMAKAPEDRYNDAIYILKDLERCENEWLATKTVSKFILGENDNQKNLQLSRKLYGREKALEELLDSLNKVNEGGVEFVLIYGYSGIGKTTLVNELKKHAIHGYFANNKYDLLKKTKPYSALIDVFKNIINQILSEPEEKLSVIRKRLQNKLGNNAQIIINAIPELEYIIGKQEEVALLNAIETENRFNFTLETFFSAIGSKENPLIIFIDDLQWADFSSIKMLNLILRSSEIEGLLLIGSYRDNEVGELHPLRLLRKRLEDEGIDYKKIELTPLMKLDVENFLVDSFKIERNKILDLAKLVYEKTNGNPFFVHEFINNLYIKKRINRDDVSGEYTWDLSLIKRENVTENVVDLLIERIKNLSLESQITLMNAACIGHEFDINILVNLQGQGIEVIANQLLEAESNHLIYGIDDSDKITALCVSGEINQLKLDKQYFFCFTHDKVQQAAYQLIPEKELAVMHYNISRMLMAEREKNKKTASVFTILDHANKALSLELEPSESLRYAEMNLTAGKEARESAAYDAALSYLRAGVNFLPNNSWNKLYSLTYELYVEMMQCLYILNQYREADGLYKLILKHIKNDIDYATPSLIRMEMFGKIDNHVVSFDTGITALKKLGVNLPKKASIVHVIIQLVKDNILLYKKDIANLDKELKITKDEKTILIFKLLHKLTYAAYFLNLNYYSYISFKTIETILKKGYSENSSTIFYSHALLMYCIFKRPELAVQFKQLADKLEINAYSPSVASQNHFIKGFGLLQWTEHPRAQLEYLRDAFQQNMQTGNLLYATYSRTVDYTCYHISLPIDEVLQQLNESMQFFKKINNMPFYRHALMMVKILNCLKDEPIANEEFVNLWKEVENDAPSMRVGSYAEFSEYHYFIGDYSTSLTYSEKFYKIREYNTGFIGMIYGWWFYGLAMIKAYPGAGLLKKFKYRLMINKILKELKYFAELYPPNYRFMYDALTAEYAILKKQKFTKVRELYSSAIESALKYGYFNYAALIAENACHYFSSQNMKFLAKEQIQQSYRAYERWGALYKCKQIAKAYPIYIEELRREIYQSKNEHDSTVVFSDAFDFKAVTSSSQTLSSEIRLDFLLEKLLKIMLEIAGAQRGLLIFEEDKELLVVAKSDNTQQIEVYLPGKPLNKDKMPLTVLTFVQRTGETIILNNKTDMTRFAKEPYLNEQHSKSMMLMPIKLQGKAIGYIFLENYMTADAFTASRLNVLNIVAGQAAISLENAEMYQASSRFIPYQLLDQLKRKNIKEIKLGDQVQQTMSILFCDIRNFTATSEKLTPAETFQLINTVLGFMSPIIKKYNGFIDKYIGDAIMALFMNADDAVTAGLNMLSELDAINQVLLKTHGISIHCGVGVNTGEVMMGIIGDQERMEGTVLGDAVNVASRVESLTKQLHHDFLISNNTKLALHKEFPLLEVGEVPIIGKEKPILIWAVKH